MSVIRHIPALPSFKQELLGVYPEIYDFPAGPVAPSQLSSSLLARLTTSLSGNIGEYEFINENKTLYIDHPDDYGERYHVRALSLSRLIKEGSHRSDRPSLTRKNERWQSFKVG